MPAHPPYLIHEDFRPPAHHPHAIRYGFFTRKGGVSQGLYSSLNGGYGSDDDAEAVRQNRQLAANALGFEAKQIAALHQIHSAKAHSITAPLNHSPNHSPGQPLAGDALVTKTAGRALMIVTADCVPVVFADSEAGVIGAAHAGWRGAVSGIIEATLDAMLGLGAKPQNITAIIGPAIQQPSYQVGAELRAEALKADAGAAICFIRDNNQKYLFDLTGYVARRLQKRRTQHFALPHDTYADAENFFSHRRRIHQGEADSGRLMTLIGLYETAGAEA